MNRSLGIALLLLAGIALTVGRALDDDGQTSQGGTVVYNAAGIAIGGIEPNPSGGVPLNIDNILASADKAVVVSADGQDTFRVPDPDSPEWADYLEYRRHFRSSLDNSPGFVVAYDPEWRSAIVGRREASAPGLTLADGRESIYDLVSDVLERTAIGDQQGMIDLALRKEEFEIICWPSFPQSRPYLRVPWEEAWGFQYANLMGGSREGFRQVEGRRLEITSIAETSKTDYRWFQIHNGLRVEARDTDNDELLTLTFLDSVIEQDGQFKVFLYKD